MPAMLSCPDSPFLSHMVGGLPFGQSMNQRRLTAAGNCCLYVWNVVESGQAGVEGKKAVSSPTFICSYWAARSDDPES